MTRKLYLLDMTATVTDIAIKYKLFILFDILAFFYRYRSGVSVLIFESRTRGS